MFKTISKVFTSSKYPTKELFTYFTPCPPSRTTGYREKELDKLFKIFFKYDINPKILNTTQATTGAWVYIELSGTESNFSMLRKDPFYLDYDLQENHSANDELEIIQEGSDDFINTDNFLK